MVYEEFLVNSSSRNELIDITSQVKDFVSRAKVISGVVTVYVPHTTAAVTINENGDPDVQKDLLWKLSHLSPEHSEYTHFEGNSDAHVKASLVGSSVQVVVHEGHLVLGTWQSIYFCDFDGARERRVVLNLN